MEIVRRINGYGTNHYIARLTEEEIAWPDLRLITYADRAGRLTNEEWEQIDKGGVHPGHFGGNVEKRGGRRTSATYAKISVYFD